MRRFLLVAVLVLLGTTEAACTTTQYQTLRADIAYVASDVHALASAALGQVTVAMENSAAVEEAKVTVAALVNAVDPKLAPTVVDALAHVNAGSLQQAQTLLKATVVVTGSLSVVAPVASQ